MELPRFARTSAIVFDRSAQTDEPRARVELLHKNTRTFGSINNALAAAREVMGEIESVTAGGAP